MIVVPTGRSMGSTVLEGLCLPINVIYQTQLFNGRKSRAIITPFKSGCGASLLLNYPTLLNDSRHFLLVVLLEKFGLVFSKLIKIIIHINSIFSRNIR